MLSVSRRLRDLTTSTKPDPEDLLALRGKLKALLGEQAGQREYAKQALSYEASREKLDSPSTIHGHSVDQIETMLEQLERDYKAMDIPGHLSAVDASNLTQDRNKAQARLMPMIGSLRKHPVENLPGMGAPSAPASNIAATSALFILASPYAGRTGTRSVSRAICRSLANLCKFLALTRE